MDFGLFVVMLFFGFMATEGTVEYILGTLFDKVAQLNGYKWALMYVSLALGIFLAFHYNLDVPFLLLNMKASPIGVVGTGIILGRGANFVNEVWQKYLS